MRRKGAAPAAISLATPGARQAPTYRRQRLVLLLQAGLGVLQRLLRHVEVVLQGSQLALDAAQLILGLSVQLVTDKLGGQCGAQRQTQIAAPQT